MLENGATFINDDVYHVQSEQVENTAVAGPGSRELILRGYDMAIQKVELEILAVEIGRVFLPSILHVWFFEFVTNI